MIALIKSYNTNIIISTVAFGKLIYLHIWHSKILAKGSSKFELIEPD